MRQALRRFLVCSTVCASFGLPDVGLPKTSADKPILANPGPLSPREEQATLRVLKGFRVELAACEPEVVDPVALAFDEHGRLFVAEMRGYPNKGVGTGKVSSGRIRMLEDRDGDGFYEKSTLFAEGLRLPTSVMPYKGGLLVANPPDLIYLEDTDGDGKADRRRVLYTGFDLANIQQMLNGLQWGIDNWVHGIAGSAGGTIKSVEKPELPAVVLRGRGVRLHPDKPGSLEPTSGGGQFGLAADDYGRFFTATNSNHLRHIVLPDHYLRRNPFLPVTAVTLDIPDHGAVCKVHRISPFEAWRVERTTSRKDGPDSKRFSPTELVPGGFITSACSPLVYRGGLFPEEYHGQSLVCDPANNIIHRDILNARGATFTARRGDADCEFLASTDNWFRPVCLEHGPDGAIYVADFYREVIETPLSLTDDMIKRLNLHSRDRGRLWRIVPDGFKRRASPDLGRMTEAELVKNLVDRNAWRRMTAQRLLVQRQNKSVAAAVRTLARTTTLPQGVVHCLWTLDGLGELADDDVILGLKHATGGVRENALRLADRRLDSTAVRDAVLTMTEDADPRVRFQLCFTLGESQQPAVVAALARLARQPADSWTQTAWLSSAAQSAPGLLENLVRDDSFQKTGGNVLSQLAFIVGARGENAGLERTLNLVGGAGRRAAWQSAVLEGLGRGLQNSRRSLDDLWTKPPAALKKSLDGVRAFFDEAARDARDARRPPEARLSAVRLLALAPPATTMDSLETLLSPTESQDLQLAAVRAIAGKADARVASVLLTSWDNASPVVRREVLEALFARSERLQALLTAIEHNKVKAGQLEPARLAQLRKHPDPKLRDRAVKLLIGQATPERRKIVEAYRPALELKRDAVRGKAIFKKTCATCHRLENEGNEVGADLLAALRNKTAETLLVDILDPSRDVDPRYIEYLLTTKSGKSMSGLIAAETASSVTLRRAEKAEDVVLRSQIESIQATAKSLMPEGLETQLARQDLADLIGYLLSVPRKGPSGSGK